VLVAVFFYLVRFRVWGCDSASGDTCSGAVCVWAGGLAVGERDTRRSWGLGTAHSGGDSMG
jgi:hypothetical protein